MLYPAVIQSLENYRPERVRELVAATKSVAAELRRRVSGNRLFETPVTIQLTGEDILELAMERGGLAQAPVVPYEATAGLAMLLLRDFGIITVHFAGVPPGTSALMIKFVPPDVLARLGGPAKLAEAIDASLTELGETLKSPGALKTLLMGTEV
jgi:L-seryl-tRNA(Ser) seleniumtransferase